jgi:hypothetical protein
MPEISTTKTPAQRAVTSAVRVATAAKKAGSAAKKDRLMGAIFAGAKTVVVSFARTLYVLWLQITGLIFLIFAVSAGSALVRQYRADHFADRHRFWTIVVFTVVCLWFGSVSFVRAKKKVR